MAVIHIQCGAFSAFLSTVKAVCFLCVVFVGCFGRAGTVKIGDYTWSYRISGSAVEICGEDGSVAVTPDPVGDIIIPDRLDDKVVIYIGDSAFAGCSNLTNVTIPSSVNGIGPSAFLNCTGLQSVTFSQGLNAIASSAFFGCECLTNVVIPASVRSVGKYAFSNCGSLMSFSVADGNYDYRSFSGLLLTKDCKTLVCVPGGLSDVEIPDCVTNIADAAFFCCCKMESLTFPKSVARIVPSRGGSMGSAFDGCGKLVSFSVDSDNAFYKSESGLLLTKDGTSLVSIPHGLSSVTIPNGVKSIGFFSFAGCENLSAVSIPDGVTSIENYAFSNCCNLRDVVFGDGITKIGYAAFAECTSLTTVIIPSGVMDVGGFQGCSSLTNVVIPSSARAIGHNAFAGCSGLISIMIPAGVTNIMSSAFARCGGLMSVTIPKRVQNIDYETFKDCHSLTNVTIPDGVTNVAESAFSGCRSLASMFIPKSVARIGPSAFWGCSGLSEITLPFVGACRGNTMTQNAVFGYIFGKSSYPGGNPVVQYFKSGQYVAYYVPSGLKKVIITDETVLGYGAFYGCGDLIDVSLPYGVTAIGECAFYNCSGFVEMEVPDSVTNIGVQAFYNCKGIVNMTIPRKMTYIGYKAFSGCNAMTNVTILSNVVNIGYDPYFGYGPFSDCENLTSIYLSREYDGPTYAFPAEATLLRYTSNPIILFDAGGGHVSPSTKLAQFGSPYGELPIPMLNGYTFVGWELDGCCVNKDTVVSALDDHTLVARWATVLSYTLSDEEVTVTGTDVDLAVLDIPALIDGYSVVAIGSKAFQYNRDIETLTIADSVVMIGKYAFQGCSNLEQGEIGRGVRTIGNFAFEQCTALRQLSIANGVETIGSYALSKCSSLETLVVPRSVTNIQWGAFANNPALTVAYLPSSLRGKIKMEREFENSTNVTICYYDGDMPVGAPNRTDASNWVTNNLAARFANPDESAADYESRFVDKFGADPVAALSMPTDKKDSQGNDMYVWQDYVAGTDPTDTNSVFTAKVEMVDGLPVVTWEPKLSEGEEARRSYTIYGKTNLTDRAWHSPTNEASRFFKVGVEMR